MPKQDRVELCLPSSQISLDGDATIRIMALDPAWLAGFFDGDGTVGIYRRKARRGHPEEWFVSVAFGQYGRAILDTIHEEFGGVIHHRVNKAPNQYGSVWNLGLSYRKAEALLRAISPHVILKQEEVEIALRFRALKNGVGKPKADRDEYARIAMELKDARKRRKEK